MQKRTCKKCRNKVGMKAPQGTLLSNMIKRKDKEDICTMYTTSVAKMCRATDVVQSLLPFFFTMFGSRVAQGALIPTLFSYFLQVLSYMTNFYRNFLLDYSQQRSQKCMLKSWNIHHQPTLINREYGPLPILYRYMDVILIISHLLVTHMHYTRA